MVRISNKKIKELIKEEKKANKMYQNYGLKTIAKQEKGHAIKLSKILGTRK